MCGREGEIVSGNGWVIGTADVKLNAFQTFRFITLFNLKKLLWFDFELTTKSCKPLHKL